MKNLCLTLLLMILALPILAADTATQTIMEFGQFLSHNLCSQKPSAAPKEREMILWKEFLYLKPKQETGKESAIELARNNSLKKYEQIQIQILPSPYYFFKLRDAKGKRDFIYAINCDLGGTKPVPAAISNTQNDGWQWGSTQNGESEWNSNTPNQEHKAFGTLGNIDWKITDKSQNDPWLNEKSN